VASFISWCGSHPFLTTKEDCLRRRGFLRPDVWHAVHVLACAPQATVTIVPGFTSKRVEIVIDGVVIVVVDHCNRGMPIILTAFLPADPVFATGAVMLAASRVDATKLVDLDARLRGEA
jgi:hypothetical protein